MKLKGLLLLVNYYTHKLQTHALVFSDTQLCPNWRNEMKKNKKRERREEVKDIFVFHRRGVVATHKFTAHVIVLCC